jgi:hypothetical protein
MECDWHRETRANECGYDRGSIRVGRKIIVFCGAQGTNPRADAKHMGRAKVSALAGTTHCFLNSFHSCDAGKSAVFCWSRPFIRSTNRPCRSLRPPDRSCRARCSYKATVESPLFAVPLPRTSDLGRLLWLLFSPSPHDTDPAPKHPVLSSPFAECMFWAGQIFCSGADIAIFDKTNIGGQAEQGDRLVCCCRKHSAIDASHHWTQTIRNHGLDASSACCKNDGQRNIGLIMRCSYSCSGGGCCFCSIVVFSSLSMERSAVGGVVVVNAGGCCSDAGGGKEGPVVASQPPRVSPWPACHCAATAACDVPLCAYALSIMVVSKTCAGH